MSYYRRGYPLISDNRLYGVLNEYSELNDVAFKNNAIYTQNIINNSVKCGNYPHYVPSIYSMPYYSPYYGLSLNPYLYSPYLSSYYPYGFRY